MHLRRSGYGIRIVLALAVAVLATGLSLLVAAHLITAGHFGDAWAVDGVWAVVWILFDGLGLTVTWLYVRGLVVNRRKAQALARRDPAVVADATPGMTW